MHSPGAVRVGRRRHPYGTGTPSPIRFSSYIVGPRSFDVGVSVPIDRGPRYQTTPATRHPPRLHALTRHQPRNQDAMHTAGNDDASRDPGTLCSLIYLYYICEFYAAQRFDLQFDVLLLLMLIGPAAGHDPAGPAKIFFTAI